MIDRNDIERKDFSIVLPAITNKISAFALLLGSTAVEHLTNDELWGLQGILEDIVADLRVINDALYPKGLYGDK